MCSGWLCGGCGTVWGFGESECAAGGFVFGVGYFGVFGEVSVKRGVLWCVWDILGGLGK